MIIWRAFWNSTFSAQTRLQFFLHEVGHHLDPQFDERGMEGNDPKNKANNIGTAIRTLIEPTPSGHALLEFFPEMPSPSKA
jgi:hypothetical protein